MAMTIRSKEAQALVENMVEAVREPFLVLDEDLRIVACSHAFYHQFRLKRENTEGRLIYELDNNQWDIPGLRPLLRKVILKRNNIEDFELRHRFEHIGEKTMLLNARLIAQEDGKSGLILLAIEDTEHKRANEELQRKTAQLEATIDSIPDGYIIYGLDRSIIRMNAVAEEIFGYTDKEQIFPYEERMTMLQLQTPTGEPFPFEHTPSSRAFAGETVRNEIMRIIRPHRHYWLSVSAAPIITSDGSMLGVVLELRDITRQKNAEEVLRESEKRFRGTFDNAAVGIAHVGLHGEWLLINDRLCEITGYQREELLHKTFQDITHPEDLESDLDLFDQVKQGKIAGYQIEKRYYHRNGQPVWVNLTVSMLRDDEDRPLYCISIVEDISERKRAEEALRESEKKFRSVFEQAAVGIGRVSFHDARWIEVNDTFSRMVGYPHEELQRIPWPQITHPDDLDLDLIPFRKMAAGELESYTVEKRFIHKKGDHVWARLTLSLVRDSKGLPDYEIAIIENISERKKAEKALQRRSEELASINRELEAFSYSVSHDLRAPLRAIIGFSSLLRNRAWQLDDKANEYLQRIEAGAQKMNVLIDDMLRLSSLSRQELVIQEIDLSSMAKAVAGDLRQRYPKRHVDINIAGDLKARGDVQLINIVLTNLLGNAWKYTGKTAEAHIEFGSSRKNGKKVFFIRDNGAGFPMKQADKLFMPFQRLHSESEFSGTGIGLPIVQRVINRHGGEIWAEGEIGKGAVFYFTLGQ